MMVYTRMDSPVGTLLLVASDAGLHVLEFAVCAHPVRRDGIWRDGAHPLLQRAQDQLQEYFAGTRQVFDLPLAPQGTPFQRTVWYALAGIAYGTTISYATLAARIGKPAARRAVGGANGRNPLPIILPCHRVIGADGSLTGYGGGLPVKTALLRLEGGLPTTGPGAGRGQQP